MLKLIRTGPGALDVPAILGVLNGALADEDLCGCVRLADSETATASPLGR